MANNPAIKITDDFLDEGEFKNILNTIDAGEDPNGSDFNWFMGQHNINPEDENYMPTKNTLFVHMFFHSGYGGWLSQYDSILHPVMDRVDPFCLIRIKINLLLNHGVHVRGEFHTDIEREDICQTAILYLDTTNGPTEFEDGSVCESVQNRFVQFPTGFRHRSVSQTDTSMRRTINFNWIPRRGNHGK